MIWDDNFAAIPAEPRYVVEKPYGSRPFTVSDKGLLVTYKAPKYDGSMASLRAEIAPRTDPDNKVGIRISLGRETAFSTVLTIPPDSTLQTTKTVLLQWYQKKGLNPPLSLELVRDELRFVRLYSLTDPGTRNPDTREVLMRHKIVRGTPYFIEVFAQFRADEHGSLELSIRGAAEPGVAGLFPGPNCYGVTEGILPKLGIYRPGVKDGTVPAGQVTKARFGCWRIS